MFKKTFSYLLVSIFITCSNVTFVSAAQATSSSTKSTVAAAADQSDSIKVNLNGKSISVNRYDTYFDSNSKVMLPLTPIIKAMDSTSNIQIGAGYATITSNKNTIKVQSGDKNITLNGTSIDLSTKSFVNNVEVFVPLQFFSEVLNKVVDFDSDSNTVNISDIQKNTETYFNNTSSLSSDKDISKKLDDYLTAEQKLYNFSGSVLVAKGGNILLDKGYNMSNFDQNIKNTPYTTFGIGSMTKQFTATAIMQLVEKGLINEQDKVSKYIPDFPNGDKITIDNLLTHTSGLADVTPTLLNMKLEDSKKVENIVNLFKNKPLYFKPGTKFKYSNSGYILLGYIVEKVSGMSYADYLQNNIFKPLNMSHTGMGYNGTIKNYNSIGYTGYLDVSPISDKSSLNALYGAGALYSCTEDLYKWDRSLKEHKLLTEKTLDKMFSKHVAISEGDDSVYYGYGWMIYDSPDGHDIFHGGNVLGFTSNIERFPDKDLTVIILSNIGYYHVNSINNALTNICFGYKYEMPKTKEVIQLDDTLLNSYVGEYSFETLGNASITNEDRHLYVKFGDLPKYEMFPESKNKFYFRIFDGTLTVNTNEKGQVTSIDLYQLGAKYTGNKVK
ncbi:serine hydrolase [Clostridium muellerianum]|nr:serine hydrolase [Clostridium muellerianum]